MGTDVSPPSSGSAVGEGVGLGVGSGVGTSVGFGVGAGVRVGEGVGTGVGSGVGGKAGSAPGVGLGEETEAPWEEEKITSVKSAEQPAKGSANKKAKRKTAAFFIGNPFFFSGFRAAFIVPAYGERRKRRRLLGCVGSKKDMPA